MTLAPEALAATGLPGFFMTLQDFIALWQAQPFRAFRIHAAHDVVTVNYPLAVALTADMKIIGITGDGRCAAFSCEEIEQFEVIGEPVSVADAINAVPPEILARNAELLAAATQSPASVVEDTKSRLASLDPGQVTLRGFTAGKGVHFVEASVSATKGGPVFTTAGTRWNLHGVDQFENGTSLYLHHADHPAVEQRVILWPPDSGTFKSFGEAKPFAGLRTELIRKDERLAKKPATAKELPAAYFRKILPIYPVIEPDDRADFFGDEPDDADFDRFEIHLVPHTLPDGGVVQNPCLVDVPAESILFSLTETDWDATFTRGKNTITLVLRHPRHPADGFEVVIDPYLLSAEMPGVGTGLPLGFIERELRNFVLHDRWNLLIGALRNGPDRLKIPDLVIPLAGDYVAEMWAGETRFPLPFLQPLILDADGATLLDFRATPWAASIVADDKRPVVTLRLWSHEKKNRCAPPEFDLKLNLVTHRVTCAGHEGSTTIGMVQAMIRHARGTQWGMEEMTNWLAKGKRLPMPEET